MPRKTIDVKFIVDKVNIVLAAEDSILPLEGKLPGIESEDPLTPAQAYRYAMSILLEAVLFETGTYAGFVYALVEVKDGELIFPDQTRRRYGTAPLLTNG